MKVDLKNAIGSCAAGAGVALVTTIACSGTPIFANEVPSDAVVNEQTIDQEEMNDVTANEVVPELLNEASVNEDTTEQKETTTVDETDNETDKEKVVTTCDPPVVAEETNVTSENVEPIMAMALNDAGSDINDLTSEEMMDLFRKYIGEDNWNEDYSTILQDYFLAQLKDSDYQTVEENGVEYVKASDDSQIDEQVAAMISFVRELNGLSSVTVTNECNAYAQAGVDYLARNNLDINHYAAYEDYINNVPGAEEAHTGLTGSNLSQGIYSNMMELIALFFGDDDATNRAVLGHRYNILDPTVTEIGVGYVQRADGTDILAVYIAKQTAIDAKKTVQYTWPNSGKCAYELIDESTVSPMMPWSIVLGSDYVDYLDSHEEIKDNLKIVIADENGTEYTIDKYFKSYSSVERNTEDILYYTDWFAFDTKYSHQLGLLKIEFNPVSLYDAFGVLDEGYSMLKGHSFTVKVEGLPDDIEYTVDFVSMIEMIEEAKETKALVANVQDLIDDIDDNVTADSKDAIDKALKAYNELTDAQKALVDSSKVTKMNEAKTACDAAIKEAELAEKASAVIEKINAIPENVSLSSADKVKAAKEAYEALDNETKTYLQGKIEYTKMTNADQALLIICASAIANANNLIDAIPSDITVDDEKAITDARKAYDALPTYDVDYKTQVTSERVSKLGNAESKLTVLKKEATDKAAAKTVNDKITALPEKEDVLLSDETAIKEARTAYDDLTEEQKAYVTAYSKLADAELKVEQLKAAQKSNQDAADEISNMIRALPDEPTLDDKSNVDSTYTKYQAMSNAQKLLVSMDDYNKLVSVKNKVDQLYSEYLENKKEADAVATKINAIPSIVTVEDEQTITDARTAYDALESSAKALVESSTVKKLTDAEEALKQAKQVIEDKGKANDVVALIGTLPSDITDDDINDVETVKAAYDALTDTQKSFVTSDAKTTLNKAVAAVAEIKKQAEEDAKKAAEIENIINALKNPADMVYDDCESVKSAKDAYDALTTKQKNFVSANVKATLTNAVNKSNELIEKRNNDIAKANTVTAIINGLPSTITLDDEASVNSAKSAYDALSDEQKAFVPESVLNKLNNSIEAVRVLKVKATADTVTNLINALPETIELKDETAIKNAAKAYDDLTDEAKTFVSKDTIDKLTNAQKDLDQAKENASNQEKADALSQVINDLPNDITLDDEKAVENARGLYDSLTAAQKLYVSEAILSKLTNAEQAIAQAHKVADDKAKAKEVMDLIDTIPENITSKDLTRIQAVEAAYNGLTDAQKAYIDASYKNRLEFSVDAVNKAVQKEIDDIKAATSVENAVYALPAVNNMKYDDTTAVYNAKNAYDNLTDDQKKLVSENVKTALTDAVNKADALVKKHNDDVSEANKVIAIIDALSLNVTLDNETAVNEAKAAYDNLTDDQKAFVSSDTLNKLNNKVDVIKALKDQAAANEAVEKIDKIPATITCDDETVINEALMAYDNLTDSAKALVNSDKVNKLTNAVRALDEAKVIKANKEAAAEVTNVIADIPKTITLKDKHFIVLALAGYENLTPAQKMYVSEADVIKLTDAVNTVNKLEAEEVEEMFGVLPDTEDITLDDEELITGLRTAYNGLSDGSKSVFDEELLQDLENAEVKIKALKQEKADKESAEQVTYLIESLNDPNELTLDDQNAVYTIYQTYKSMTAKALALLSQKDRDKIENCFARMNILVEADKIAQATGITSLSNSPNTGVKSNNLTTLFASLLGIVGIGAAGVYVKRKRDQE